MALHLLIGRFPATSRRRERRREDQSGGTGPARGERGCELEIGPPQGACPGLSGQLVFPAPRNGKAAVMLP